MSSLQSKIPLKRFAERYNNPNAFGEILQDNRKFLPEKRRYGNYDGSIAQNLSNIKLSDPTTERERLNHIFTTSKPGDSPPKY